ncbi:S9 family peptidase [Bdellovibrio sp. NC01]|uniref:S9 family peptidase n=1 Tax=Bdellovibrio sp. NC01 TaxID=2220073 RepID=UPI001158A924|nr:S9 family peptidase [Bdellovibrio sp. NC01]QDK38727.1 oligopeptidase B [Bdellovibrio sp. NC01]
MAKKTLTPPQASKHPTTFKNHGDTRVDDYFWLRDKNHPETMPYLHAENAYFQSVMKPLQAFKNKLFKEMKARIKENDSSVPAPDGSYLYTTKFKKGKQYAIHTRKPKKGGREVVILDGNVVAKGKKYFALASMHISAEENTLAYAVDFDGSERHTIHFKNLKSNKILKDTLLNSSGNGMWAADGMTYFYVVLDANLRPFQVWRHTLGEDVKNDVLVYEEKDAQFFVGVEKSESEDMLYIHTGGKITTEVWYLSAHEPHGHFKCIEPRKEGIEYSVTDREGEFWVHTNYKATNFQIMKTSLQKPGRKNWKTFIKNSDAILRTGLMMFKDFMVITEREGGLPQIRIYDFTKKKDHLVSFADKAYDVSLGANREFETEALRISYSSPITPDSVIEYNMKTRKSKTLKTKEVKGHKKANYVCERVWVKSHDGVKVPLTLVYRKGLKKNGKAPGYLYGYGSYGMSIPDAFPARRDVFRLIDRGFVYALAHPRGGSEMGRYWYEDGKFLKKKNTFLDFNACGDYLIKSGLVAKDKLAACGGSAGGMLMGACMNMRPDLYSAIAAHVPFVDVINTMFDKDLPLTQIEYKEWGNPADKKYYKYMKSYSPYDNVEAKAYPTLFVTCGLNDPRVTYWEPAKWVSKLRELKTDSNTLVFKTNMGAGHFGVSGRFDHLWEQAEEYAFIMNKFGITK